MAPLLPLLLSLACVDPAPAPTPASAEAPAEPPAPLPPTLLLARRSLDLIGRRPTLAELDAVEADPAALDRLTAQYLADPAFPRRMAWLWNDSLHTAIWPSTFTRFGDWTADQWVSVGQEPLQVVAAVIAEDRPFSAVVTETRSQMNGTLAALYGYDGVDGDWGWFTYPDQRPMAGLLSTNVLWLRTMADAVNFNRARANTLARVFLCADFLERQGGFTFDVDPASLTRVERAVAEEPACLTCHAALDPLASLFGGFAERSDELPLSSFVTYSPFAADWFSARQAPGYYGLPVADLSEVGPLVAADPRFTRCVARRFAEGMLGAPLTDEAELDVLSGQLSAQDLRVAPFVNDLLGRPLLQGAEPRVLSTEQLHSALSDFLGLSTDGAIDAGLNPLLWSVDHRVLGGGTDDDTVTTRAPNLGLGPALVAEWAARAAAAPALAADRARSPADRRLLTVDGADAAAPAEAAVRAQLVRWLREAATLTVAADSPTIDGLFAIYQRGADPDAGYTLALQAVLRHPAVWIH